MFKPEIHWHYAGRLRAALEDAACESCVKAILDALRSPAPGRMFLCVPVPRPDVFEEVLKRAFGAASLHVYTSTLHNEQMEYGLSTVFEPDKASYKLFKYAGSVEGLVRHLRANTFLSRVFSKADERGAAEVVLAFPNFPSYPPPKRSACMEECRRMLELARGRGHRVELLPEPGLDLDATLNIIKTVPSRILDGSHPWERSLEKQIEKEAESSPAGYLIRAAWRTLKSEAGPEVFSLRAYDARLESLDQTIAGAFPWEAIFGLWREVLLGFESDREYAGRWYKEVYSHGDGWVSLEDLNDILLYENSLYILHCEVDPSCLSYPVAYYGSFWLQRRMALASLFGGRRTSGEPSLDLSWD